MPVVVFADETGTHDPTGKKHGSEMVGVAGYVSWADDWAKFCNEWKSVLDRFQLTSFHMADFANLKHGPKDPHWPYRHLSSEQRDSLLFELAPIAKRRTQFGVASLISTRAYNRVIPSKGQKWIRHPLYMSLLPFYGGILSEIERRRWFPETKLTFIFDRTKEFATGSIGMFNLIKQHTDDHHRLAEIAFSDPQEHPEIQAADLLAYAARQKALALVSKDDRSIRPLDEALGLGTHVLFSCETAQSMQKKVEENRKIAGINWNVEYQSPHFPEAVRRTGRKKK